MSRLGLVTKSLRQNDLEFTGSALVRYAVVSRRFCTGNPSAFQVENVQGFVWCMKMYRLSGLNAGSAPVCEKQCLSLAA